MDVLVPIDGSECSFRALEFSVRFASLFDASIHVVHITDHRTEATDQLLQRAEEYLEENRDISSEIELLIDIPKFRGSDRIGKNIVSLIDENGYDHIVMGHHGTGRIGRALLGSAAETVIRSADSPVTIIP